MEDIGNKREKIRGGMGLGGWWLCNPSFSPLFLGKNLLLPIPFSLSLTRLTHFRCGISKRTYLVNDVNIYMRHSLVEIAGSHNDLLLVLGLFLNSFFLSCPSPLFILSLFFLHFRCGIPTGMFHQTEVNQFFLSGFLMLLEIKILIEYVVCFFL